jgi:uncharacterized protein (DUF362 family)
MDDVVAIVTHEGDVEATLTQALSLIGGFEITSPVVVKPNICADYDRSGFAVTRTEVVDALLTLMFKRDRRLPVKIVESDSGAKWADEAYNIFGYTRLATKMRRAGFDVTLLNLSHAPTSSVRLDGQFFRDPELPDLVVGPNYLVSVAVAKTHGIATITGAMKNLFGLIPRKDQRVYHPHIHDVIVDLCRVVRTDLAVVDARVGLDGWMGVKRWDFNAFIVGRNPVSVDAVMASAMGFDPSEIPHLHEAEKFGLGSLTPEIVGMNLKTREW